MSCTRLYVGSTEGWCTKEANGGFSSIYNQVLEIIRGHNSIVRIIITKETKLPLRGKLHRTLGTLLRPFKGLS